MFPTVTVWQGGQLKQTTTLPQFNATSGGQTQSIQITNNSDVALTFDTEITNPITILPRYRLTAPVDPNRQYNISIAANQIGSSADDQYVTLTESTEAAPFSLEPLTISVDVARLRQIAVITTNPPGSTGGITNPFSLLPSEQSLVIYCTFVQGGHTASATITQGNIQGITVSFTSTDSWVRVPAFGMMSGTAPNWQVSYSCDSVVQPSNLYIFASSDPPPFGPDYNQNSAQVVQLAPSQDPHNINTQGVAKVATTGVAVQLRTLQTITEVIIKARRANVGTIYLGGPSVTNNETTTTGGLQLDPGDMIAIREVNLGNIYINGTSGDGVSFVCWA